MSQPHSTPPPVPVFRHQQADLPYAPLASGSGERFGKLLLWYFIIYGVVSMAAIAITMTTPTLNISREPLDVASLIFRVLGFLAMIAGSALVLTRVRVTWILIVGAALLFIAVGLSYVATFERIGWIRLPGTTSTMTGSLPSRYVWVSVASQLTGFLYPLLALFAALEWGKLLKERGA